MSVGKQHQHRPILCLILAVCTIILCYVVFPNTLGNNDNKSDGSKPEFSNSGNNTKHKNYFNKYVHTLIQDINLIHQLNKDIRYMLNASLCNCMVPWPKVENCAFWYEDNIFGWRYLLSNSIPVYFVEPYCPFGMGDGYCFTGTNHKNCSVFANMSCPAQTHHGNRTGDVPVAQLFLYRMKLNPNPLNYSLPINIYNKDPLLWSYNNGTGDSNFEYNSVEELELKAGLWKYSDLLDTNDDMFDQTDNFEELGTFGDNDYTDENDTQAGWAVIALHLTGQQIKGPDEAEGMNVDYVGLHLETSCGGHVTPPVDLGPLYHYHKAALCLEKFPTIATMKNEITEINSIDNYNKDELIAANYGHSELQAYGNDGFGIYGLYDFDLREPVLDECNGHFGATGKYYNGPVTYHYHYRNFTWNATDPQSEFIAYYLGCQGPSKGRCNETVDGITGYASPVCSPGCGYQVCVQPGTSDRQLKKYLRYWGDENWLDQFTVNPF